MNRRPIYGPPKMQVGYVYHYSWDISGVLARIRRGGPWKLNSRIKTRQEAIDALEAELAQGHKFASAGAPCEGWTPQSGCPGHAKNGGAE